jgi:DNA polymerase III sliding clamp (beta) subunit (PCNA family)
MLFLPKNVAALAQIAATEATRYTLACVRVIACPGGWYRLEATDGRRLAIVQGPSKEPRVPLPGLDFAPNGQSEVLIPVQDWKAAFKQAGKNDVIGLVAGAELVTLATARTTTTCQPGEGRFPAVDQVLPRTPPLVRFLVNPLLLASLCQLAHTIDPEGNRLEVLYYGDGKPLGLMARNNDDQTLDCLLMPLT